LKKAVHIIVSGVVQGVGFRFYTKEKADTLSVFGTVTNLPNGNVEIYAQAEKDPLNAFLIWCHDGPSSSRVDTLEYEFIESLDANDFSIIR